MTIEKQSRTKATIDVQLHRNIGHDKNRTPYWTVMVMGNGTRLISIQNFDEEHKAEKSYTRLKELWKAQ